MTQKYILYFDDTGNRDPDAAATDDRQDKMDCFGQGVDAGKENWYRRERLRGNRTGYPWWFRKAEAI